MKNANVFIAFILIIFLIYPISVYSYNKSKQNNLAYFPVIINGFSYKIISDNGDEIFFEGDSLIKQIDKITIENPKGYHINKENRKISFMANTAISSSADESIELTDNIKISQNNTYIEAKRIIYNRKQKKLFSPDRIRINFNDSLIEGIDLVYDLEEKRAVLKNIRGRLWLSNIF
ncbi:MAG: LPS export ABC transporter periplasmic protein LptC [Proteobacteria bacterium]|nr:LPS export ABC transporter periplasmic protein LptC [Pseudomonadota bacterium]